MTLQPCHHVSANVMRTFLSYHPVPAPSVQAIPLLQSQAVHPQVQSYNAIDLVITSAYGIPKHSLPLFKSGRESDFALLKMALDNLLENHPHLIEQYKYQAKKLGYVTAMTGTVSSA